MRIEELEKRAAVKRRTVRHYIDIGLLPRPPNHAWKTEYTEEHLFRLRAIRILRLEHGMSPSEVRKALKRMPRAELEALVRMPSATPSPSAPPALGVAPTPAASPAATTLAPSSLPVRPPGAPIEAPSADGEAWQRFVLLDGLELSVRADASPVVKRLAAEVRAQFSAPRAPMPPPSAAIEAPRAQSSGGGATPKRKLSAPR
jgi:DNA-binding transcriptional MerR regulator